GLKPLHCINERGRSSRSHAPAQLSPNILIGKHAALDMNRAFRAYPVDNQDTFEPPIQRNTLHDALETIHVACHDMKDVLSAISSGLHLTEFVHMHLESGFRSDLP